MSKVLGLGNALVDILIQMDDDSMLEKLLLPKGTMTLIDVDQANFIARYTEHLSKSISPGGSAANTIHGLSRMGVETGYIGSIAEDAYGTYFKNGLEDFGTNTFLNYSLIETGRATTLISPDSERTFGTYLGAAIDLKAHMLKPDHFKGFDFLHFEGYLVQDKELVMRAVELAKQNNMTISVDMASFNIVESNREFFKMLISEHVDIVFANEDEARSLTGKEPDEALHDISEKCQIAVIKLGEKGSIVKSGEEIAAIQAIPAKSIDTTGAGDLYAAGFLLGLTRNKPLHECGSYGSLLAGKTIEVFGAKMDEERWKRVQAVIPHTQEILK